MHGSLCLSGGVLYVGRHAKSASVTAFDLDGRMLRMIVRFRDSASGRSAAHDLCVDGDHRLWVADGPGGCVRGFTLFGIEVANLPGPEAPSELRDLTADVQGNLGAPTGVLALGTDEDMVIVVASGGRRRHAVQVLQVSDGRNLSLRPLGDPKGRFENICAIAARGKRELLVMEGDANRIQVFRGGDFHFSIPLDGDRGRGKGGDCDGPGSGARPTALALSPEGNCIVAFGGDRSGVWMFDDNGKVVHRIVGGDEGATAGGGVQQNRPLDGLQARMQEVDGRPGIVEEPCALALAPAEGMQPTRLFIMDRFGDRVQVFTLKGVCYGAFPALVS